MNSTDFLRLSISAALLIVLAGVAALSVMSLYTASRRAPRSAASHKRLGELRLCAFVGPVAGVWDHMRPVERRLYLYGALIEGPLGALAGHRSMLRLLGGRPLRGRRGRGPGGTAGRSKTVCLPVGIRMTAAGSAIELTIEAACVCRTGDAGRRCSPATPYIAYTVRRFRNDGTSESALQPNPLGVLLDHYAGYRPPTRRNPHTGSAGSP